MMFAFAPLEFQFLLQKSYSPNHTAMFDPQVPLILRTQNSAKCNRPLENAYYFHSCTVYNSNQQRSTTDCFCSLNYPTRVTLVCTREKTQWYFQAKNSKNPCFSGGDTSPVYLVEGNQVEVDNSLDDDQYAYDDDDDEGSTSFRDGSGSGSGSGPSTFIRKANPKLCNKPEEYLNIFHSCSIHDKTSATCYCTANYPTKINLSCKNGAWYMADKENPCEEYFHPARVYCYKEGISGKVICNCMSNCYTLNLKPTTNMGYLIHTCTEGALSLNTVDNETMTSYIDSKDSTLVKYACTNDYKLVGNDRLTCNKGKLSGELPMCVPTKPINTITTETTPVLLDTIQQVSSLNNKCNKPVIDDAVFNKCSDIEYPAKETSCYCTMNYPEKLHLICGEDMNWHIKGDWNPCKVISHNLI